MLGALGAILYVTHCVTHYIFSMYTNTIKIN